MTQQLNHFAALNELYTLAVLRNDATKAAILWNCILQMSTALQNATKAAITAATTMENN